MTSFKITNDDIGVRGLQENNKQPVTSEPVTPVKASNPVQASPENQPVKPLQIDRRGSERRQVDRRQTGSSVLLDTRSQHDRRTKTGHRDSDADTKKPSPTLRGIDEEV